MRKIFLLGCAVFSLSSCVTAKLHKELQAKYKELDEKNVVLRKENDELKAELGRAKDQVAALTNSLDKLKEETSDQTTKYLEMQDRYKDLNKNYEYLLDNNNALLSSNQAENRKLMARMNTLQTDLQGKEDSLKSEQEKLEYLSRELQKREARVYELESLIAEQEAKVNMVRNKLKEALFNFEGKGLTVEQRDGKVYVSLENSLVFPSASWAVEPKGREALNKLAQVLAENPDLNVMVEGHTDSDAFNGNTAVKDNWDLSVMRATSIVKILTSTKGVNPMRITAAGRSEYLPLVTNDSPEGKAKNRRTEIIITPDLDKIVKVLGEVK